MAAKEAYPDEPDLKWFSFVSCFLELLTVFYERQSIQLFVVTFLLPVAVIIDYVHWKRFWYSISTARNLLSKSQSPGLFLAIGISHCIVTHEVIVSFIQHNLLSEIMNFPPLSSGAYLSAHLEGWLLIICCDGERGVKDDPVKRKVTMPS